MVVSPLPFLISFHIVLLYPLILYEHQLNLQNLQIVDYQDSEILEDWEDLFDVHTILGETKQEYERKLQIAQAKQPKAEW